MRALSLAMLSLCALCAPCVAVTPAAAQKKAKDPTKPKKHKSASADTTRKPYKNSPLFSSDTALHVTLVGDWKALGGDRDTLHPKLRPASLRYTAADGKEVAIPIHLATRGNFRLLRASCNFPPLRVVLDSGPTKGTLFARQHALKLGVHCVNNSNEYEQYVLREYLVYRAHNLITDLSFRPRLARVRYVDARDTTKSFERWGMFLESERELGARLGGRVLTARGGLYDDVTPESAGLLGLWEYFIGNTDFSMAALHNVRLVARPDGMNAVPYDFDFSGLVDTRYATPDSRLGIPSVKTRLYRGPCLTEQQLAPLVARFDEKKGAIRALYDSLPGLDRAYARRATDYIEAFYDEAKNRARFAKDLHGACHKGT